MAFHLKKRRAQMVIEVEDAELCPDLGMGEVIVVPARSSEASYRLQLPIPDADGLNLIANSVFDGPEPACGVCADDFQDGATELAVQTPYNSVQDSVQMHVQDFIPSDTLTKALRVRRVQDLLAQGMGIVKIVETVWNVQHGGSAAYKQARAEYDEIVAKLQEWEVD